MKLLRETLVNFKGIRDYTFSPQAESVSVSGDNGSGKTSLLDGFLWVLFDRDSAGHRDFELKTLDESGAVIPMLEHSVEIEIEHAGRRRQLKKTLSENWVRARGAATAEFSGHRTVYELDHVPLQKKEYDAAIAAMCDETLLRILTDPLYFAAKLPWQERRRILLELCGELSDAELIATDDRLGELPALLAGRSLEEFRRQLAAQKQLVNGELRAIPVRVDEVSRAMPPVEPAAELTAEPASEPADAGRLAELQAAAATHETERRRLTQQCQQAEGELSAAKRRRGELDSEVARLAAQLAEKRAEWNRQNSRGFVWDNPAVCPSCGQAIPAELAAAARQKAAAQFAAEQARQLERLTVEGQALLASQQQKQQEVQNLIASLPTLEAAVGAANTALADLPEASADPGELTAARQAAAELARRQAVAAQRQQAETRIAELTQREESLAAEYAELERQQFLGEEFLRVKVARLEERINGCFHLARFRLFEQQVNGALCEVCEVLGPDRVPFNSGLNHAACINTGLDIINSLSAHYGLTAPIFIDNAEAVTTLIETPAQLIRLLVSEDESALAMRQDAKPAAVAGKIAPEPFMAAAAVAGAEPVAVSISAGPGF
jgi:DNA repair exonuclease SbcCD ATPase subunit